MDLSSFIDLSDPASHCNQDHDHSTLPWPLSDCDWLNQLAWSMSDTGYNEGAAQAAYAVAQAGIGLPASIANLAGDVLANAWPRRDMMRFAIWLASSGNAGLATATAVVSQWHNCHAFQCLVYHADEVSQWLSEQ